MATTVGGATKEKKGKKAHKNKLTSKKYACYDSDGKRTKKFCPRCGPGTFLANHKERIYCGTCHYTEFVTK